MIPNSFPMGLRDAKNIAIHVSVAFGDGIPFAVSKGYPLVGMALFVKR
jgi:hypothetical protein